MQRDKLAAGVGAHLFAVPATAAEPAAAAAAAAKPASTKSSSKPAATKPAAITAVPAKAIHVVWKRLVPRRSVYNEGQRQWRMRILQLEQWSHSDNQLQQHGYQPDFRMVQRLSFVDVQ